MCVRACRFSFGLSTCGCSTRTTLSFTNSSWDSSGSITTSGTKATRCVLSSKSEICTAALCGTRNVATFLRRSRLVPSLVVSLLILLQISFVRSIAGLREPWDRSSTGSTSCTVGRSSTIGRSSTDSRPSTVGGNVSLHVSPFSTIVFVLPITSRTLQRWARLNQVKQDFTTS